MKILVTPRSVTKHGHPALVRLKEAGYEVVFPAPGQSPSESELLTLLPGCVGYLAGVETISARVLNAATDLKVISRNGTGVDNIDAEAARRHGIRICRAEGANARGVAELAFAHLLAAVRQVPLSDSGLKQGKWERRKGLELEGRILGLIGCGMIGRLVTKFALAFDMTVLAYDPHPNRSFKPSEQFSYVSLDEVLTRADIISLHCPLQAGGAAIIDRQAISRMKHGVYVINTARAGLMDAGAVLEAIDSGKIAGVTVDAFESEPPEDWRLVKHERVIGTPHVGGFTDASIDRAISVSIDNLLMALEAARQAEVIEPGLAC
ncbi:MAG: phosphoglycerate dehydrogenase [Verrucomicrobia bacterium]|nr:phosphoglycerate dehydrogenase [Verrucomicrobiota bacterium]